MSRPFHTNLHILESIAEAAFAEMEREVNPWSEVGKPDADGNGLIATLELNQNSFK